MARLFVRILITFFFLFLNGNSRDLSQRILMTFFSYVFFSFFFLFLNAKVQASVQKAKGSFFLFFTKFLRKFWFKWNFHETVVRLPLGIFSCTIQLPKILNFSHLKCLK